jgi:hypothetical protein
MWDAHNELRFEVIESEHTPSTSPANMTHSTTAQRCLACTTTGSAAAAPEYAYIMHSTPAQLRCVATLLGIHHKFCSSRTYLCRQRDAAGRPASAPLEPGLAGFNA